MACACALSCFRRLRAFTADSYVVRCELSLGLLDLGLRVRKTKYGKDRGQNEFVSVLTRNPVCHVIPYLYLPAWRSPLSAPELSRAEPSPASPALRSADAHMDARSSSSG